MEDLLQEQVVEVVEGSLTLDQHPLEVVQELDTKVMVELLELMEPVVAVEVESVGMESSSLHTHTLYKENI